MRTRHLMIIAICALTASIGALLVLTRKAPDPGRRSSVAGQTLGDRQRLRAEAMIKANPTRPEGYNLLTAALLQKARETGNEDLLEEAEAAITRSISLAPDSFSAQTLLARVLVSHHEFSEALQVARRAQTLRADNPDVYGVIADASTELGDYRGAVEAAQKMMDLRPDAASYTRAAYLRSLHGDVEGAIEALDDAMKATNPSDAEGAAWCRVQLANLLLSMGKPVEAERQAGIALQTFPGYHEASAMKGRILAASDKLRDAADFFEQAQRQAPSADVAAALGDVYAKLGLPGDATRLYERAELIEKHHAPSRHLALFWAEHDMRLEEALAIAQAERSRRSDVYTCDALAWCLFKNGRVSEARASIEEALRLGTRDAGILYHAGMICIAQGARSEAAKYLQDALRSNTSFDNSVASFSVLQGSLARKALNKLLVQGRTSNGLPPGCLHQLVQTVSSINLASEDQGLALPHRQNSICVGEIPSSPGADRASRTPINEHTRIM